MKNETIGLTETDFAEIKRTAAEYQIEELQFRPTKKGGNFPFQHIAQGRPWVFVIDWHWRRRCLRFDKTFIARLQKAGLVFGSPENGAGMNCSVRYEDFTKALQLCVSETPAQRTRPESRLS
jgi:hypothetical protein